MKKSIRVAHNVFIRIAADLAEYEEGFRKLIDKKGANLSLADIYQAFAKLLNEKEETFEDKRTKLEQIGSDLDDINLALFGVNAPGELKDTLPKFLDKMVNKATTASEEDQEDLVFATEEEALQFLANKLGRKVEIRG